MKDEDGAAERPKSGIAKKKPARGQQLTALPSIGQPTRVTRLARLLLKMHLEDQVAERQRPGQED